MNKAVKDTPCIGVCSTVYGDDVCRGCKRTIGQITDWNSADEAKRIEVYGELNDSLLLACAGVLQVIDLTLLAQKIELYAVRMPRGATGEAQAYFLLRAGGQKMQRLHKYGIKALPGYDDQTPWQLFQIIDQRWYGLRAKETGGETLG